MLNLTSLKNKTSVSINRSQINMKNPHKVTLSKNKRGKKKIIDIRSMMKKINMIGMKIKIINPKPKNLSKRIKKILATIFFISIKKMRVNRHMVHQLKLKTLQAKYLMITLKKQKKISWLVKQPCQVFKIKSLKSTMLKAQRLNR